ncbi:MAG: hypothetical protein J7M05_00070 [Anaerolineae bacterium]|nr:hypothetical protein [Anaerolineae bacterium]
MPSSRPPVHIQVDRRELGSGVPEQLKEIGGVTLEVASLPLADYILSPRLAVERKSANDLEASIIDRRLFAQVAELAQRYERVVYLIEGPTLYGGRLHPNAIRGALSYLLVLAGVSVLRSEGPEDSAQLLATMARHEQHGLGYEVPLHQKRRSPSPQRQVRYLVEDLPGIGPQTADALLRHFGTLERLFGASEEELCQVPGIGPKRARAIRELLTLPYETK